MPQMADITVKAANGTTDVIYANVSASAGNNVPAIWQVTALTTPASTRPELRVTSVDSKDGTKRIVRGQYRYPQTVTDSTTGIVSVFGSATGDFSLVIDKALSKDTVDQQAAQLPNLLVSALMKAVFQSGYAPT